MRTLIVLILGLALAASATAQDLGNKGPVKSPQSYPENIPNPLLQGGDTIASATLIPALPYTDSGTTVGYTDNYDAVCPYTNSTAPDVVYKYVAGSTIVIDIDLCGSTYDTKLYVYDAAMALIACNDDFYFDAPCGTYVSQVENVHFNAGGTYYIIVDGYGNASGSYVLSILPCGKCACPVYCPDGGQPEGEPALVDDYVDNWNGGCNTTPGYPFQFISGGTTGDVTLCGVSGWYNYQGSQYRDTDWYVLLMGPDGTIEIRAQAEFDIYIYELGPQDCDAIGIVQQATGNDCEPFAELTISGYAPGAPVWFWVGPTVFAPPAGWGNEYDYVVWFSGLEPAIAIEATTWSTVKALYE